VLRDTLALFTVEKEQPMPGTCMEHEVVGLVEHKTKLLQVVGHQRGPRWLLGKHYQAVNVLYGFECLL